MPYCAYGDVKKNLPEETLVQLTDDEGVGTVNQARLSEAIAQADAEINAYLGARFSVPFSPIPEIVRTLSANMAIYHLYARRMEEIPKTRADRYNNALKTLGKIAAGEISIGAAEGAEEMKDRIRSSTSEEDRIFSRGKRSDGSSGSLDNY